MKNKLIFGLLILFILFPSFCFAQEGKGRLGFGVNSGFFIGLYGGNYYTLSYSKDDFQIDGGFSNQHVAAGPGLFDTFNEVAYDVLHFSLLFNLVGFNHKYVRGKIGAGVYGTRSSQANVIRVFPSAKIGWEFGAYRGLTSMLEFGFPILLSTGLIVYL
jgi:hypothetical protein